MDLGRAAGLKVGAGAGLGSADKGLGLLDYENFPPLGAARVGRLPLGPSSSGSNGSRLHGPNVVPDNNLMLKNPMKSMIDNLSEKSKGSGFFDVSLNNFGHRKSPNLEVKNTFDAIQNDEDCFDIEYGLWEKDMLMVRKFYETNTPPSDDVFKSWSEKLRAYYVMLTKFDPVNEAMVETKNEDEIEVESETDESVRDIVRGV
ncbi:hypothetical protein Hanom_Chr17g01586931 [Helianthus anomalus]